MSQPNNGAGLTTLGPVQVIPPGLTGLLQLKQLGRVPGELSQLVEFNIEARDWYFQARREGDASLFPSPGAQTATIATGGIGFHPFLFGGLTAGPPLGQAWYVEHFSCTGQVNAAADSVSFCLVVQDANSGSIHQVGAPYIDTINARVRNFMAFNTRGGFWAGPADVFGIFVFDVVAGVSIPLMQLRMRATRLPL